MNKLNVFVLEDNVFQRNIIKSVLKKIENIEIVEFENGKDAYEFLKDCDKEFGIFILDLNVPGYDGLKFLEKASKITSLKNVLVVSAMEDDVLKSVDAYGISKKRINFAICRKPIIPLEFLNEINKFIKKSEHKNMVYPESPRREITKTFTIEEIKEAIEKKGFLPHYQPQINILENKVAGLEALARWNHPEFGLVPPYKFIPVIEFSDNSIKQEFTFLMLEKIAEDLLLLKKMGFVNLKISLNAFLSILELEDFCDNIAFLLKKYGIEKDIVLEVTESGISKAKSNLSYSLSRLRIKEIELSLDDFGTGYASLLQLASLPFTEIKIDRSFVKNIHKDKKNYKIVKMAKFLADELGLKIIAEGCETVEEVDKLKELKIDILQGYYFSKPLEFKQIKTFLSNFD